MVFRLLNGRNLTRQPDDVWLTPFDPGSPPTVTINFAKPSVLTGKSSLTDQHAPICSLAGISFWNYNVSPEMSYAGVRLLHIFVNGRLAANNVLLRKAPGLSSDPDNLSQLIEQRRRSHLLGFVFFDFVQDISIERPQSIRPLIRPTTNSVYGCEQFLDRRRHSSQVVRCSQSTGFSHLSTATSQLLGRRVLHRTEWHRALRLAPRSHQSPSRQSVLEFFALLS